MSGAFRLFASPGLRGRRERDSRRPTAMARDLAARITSAWGGHRRRRRWREGRSRVLASVQRDHRRGLRRAHARRGGRAPVVDDRRRPLRVGKDRRGGGEAQADAIKKTAEEAESARTRRLNNRADAFARSRNGGRAIRERAARTGGSRVQEGLRPERRGQRRTLRGKHAGRRPRRSPSRGGPGSSRRPTASRPRRSASSPAGSPGASRAHGRNEGRLRGALVTCARRRRDARRARRRRGALRRWPAAQAEQLRDTARESRLTPPRAAGAAARGAVSGVGADRMAAGVANLAQNLRDAPGRQRHRRSAPAPGVDLRDGNGQVRATGDIIDDLAVAFERVPSPIPTRPHRDAALRRERAADARRRYTGPGGLRALRES